MVKVIIYVIIMVDGFMVDVDGGVDWMFGFLLVLEDQEIVD